MNKVVHCFLIKFVYKMNIVVFYMAPAFIEIEEIAESSEYYNRIVSIRVLLKLVEKISVHQQ